jgi:hypothetical protein
MEHPFILILPDDHHLDTVRWRPMYARMGEFVTPDVPTDERLWEARTMSTGTIIPMKIPQGRQGDKTPSIVVPVSLD